MRLKLAFVSLAALGLAACSSSSGPDVPPVSPSSSPVSPSAPARPAEPPPAEQRPAAPAPGHPPAGNAVAREAFAKTLAAGETHWNLKNAVVEYQKSAGRGGPVKEKWTARCAPSHAAAIKGAYPNVSLNLGGFDCGAGHAPRELTYLSLISVALNYEATHIPAYPSEPNQFRLSLAGFAGFSVLQWKSSRALNALIKDHVAFFDFVGEERGAIGFADDRHHFAAISFQSDDGSGGRFRLNYTVDENGPRSDSTDIKIGADLEKAP